MAEISRYLLDTNTSSYIIKGNIPTVREQLQKVPIAQVCISAITRAELLFGVEKRPEGKSLKVAVHEFLAHVDILPWDENAAGHYAEIRADLERKGLLLGNMDMLIAAHARALNAILVTNDSAFKRVERIRLVNWADE